MRRFLHWRRRLRRPHPGRQAPEGETGGGGGRGLGEPSSRLPASANICDELVVSPAQVVKLHTKLGKPIPSTEPSMVAQNSSSSSASTTASSSKTTAASLNSSSQCLSSGSASSSSTYLKPVSIVSGNGGSMGVKNPSVGSLSAATASLTAKKVNAPKINFVGA